MKRFLFTICLLFLPVLAYALPTITNTVSWVTEPANVQTYKVEKQVQTNGDTNAPFTALPTLTVGTKQFVDAGNTPGVNVCYRVTPQNSLPSSGAPQTKCSTTIGPVGDMTTITIVPSVIP